MDWWEVCESGGRSELTTHPVQQIRARRCRTYYELYCNFTESSKVEIKCHHNMKQKYVEVKVDWGEGATSELVVYIHVKATRQWLNWCIWVNCSFNMWSYGCALHKINSVFMFNLLNMFIFKILKLFLRTKLNLDFFHKNDKRLMFRLFSFSIGDKLFHQ